MEGGWNKKVHPSGCNRGGKRQILTADDIDEQCLDSSKHTGKRMEETSNDSDRMFVLSLLPAMKHLSPLHNRNQSTKTQT